MNSEITLTDIAVQLATLNTKMDNVVETVAEIKEHRERLIALEKITAAVPETIEKVDMMEKFHYKVMGGLGVTTAVGAFLAWFSGVYHDLFK